MYAVCRMFRLCMDEADESVWYPYRFRESWGRPARPDGQIDRSRQLHGHDDGPVQSVLDASGSVYRQAAGCGTLAGHVRGWTDLDLCGKGL